MSRDLPNPTKIPCCLRIVWAEMQARRAESWASLASAWVLAWGVPGNRGWHRCSAQLLMDTPLGKTGVFLALLFCGARNVWQAVSLAACFSGGNESHGGVIRVTLCWIAGTRAHHREPLCCDLVNPCMSGAPGCSPLKVEVEHRAETSWLLPRGKAQHQLICWSKGAGAWWGEEGVSFWFWDRIYELPRFCLTHPYCRVVTSIISEQSVDNIVKCTAEFWLLGVWTNSQY